MRFTLLIIAILSAIAVFAIPFELQPEDATVMPPSVITIDILVTNSEPIYGFELQIVDAPERATFSHIEATPRISGALITSAIQGASIVKIGVILSGTGAGITAGTGSVLRVKYGVSSGNEEITFTPSNLKAYNSNGTLIAGITATATAVQLEPSSSGGSSSSGSSGGGGSGGGSSSSSSGSGGSSSASTSTSSLVPFENLPAQATPTETPVPQPPDPIETSTAEPEEQPLAQSPPSKKKNMLPFIIGAIVLLIAGAMAYYFIKTEYPPKAPPQKPATTHQPFPEKKK